MGEVKAGLHKGELQSLSRSGRLKTWLGARYFGRPDRTPRVIVRSQPIQVLCARDFRDYDDISIRVGVRCLSSPILG